jgi:hypothetical protein
MRSTKTSWISPSKSRSDDIQWVSTYQGKHQIHSLQYSFTSWIRSFNLPSLFGRWKWAQIVWQKHTELRVPYAESWQALHTFAKHQYQYRIWKTKHEIHASVTRKEGDRYRPRHRHSNRYDTNTKSHGSEEWNTSCEAVINAGTVTYSIE